MTYRAPTLAVAVLAVLALTAAGPTPAEAQAGARARTPWGDPDIQGTWTTDETIGVPVQRPVELGTKAFLTDADLAERAERQRQARVAAAGRAGGAGAAGVGPPDHWGESATQPVRQTSFVVDPPDGRIPAVTPEGQRRAAPRDTGSFGGGPFNEPKDFTNFDRCISRGVVGSLMPRPYGNGLDIVQAPGVVAIRYEMIHEPRIIPLTTQPHVGQGLRSYMGDARGRWEGETLVVETTNFTDEMSIGFNGNGLRHSTAMKLTERFTRKDDGLIQYEVVLDDPITYTKPFKIALPIHRSDDYMVYQYACHEGNYGMTNILSGARATEAAAKGGSR